MTDAESSQPEGHHHGLAAHEVVLLLETHAQLGLDDDEVSRRLDRYGPLVPPSAQTDGPLVRFVRQFQSSWLIYVLLVSVGITVALGEITQAAVIFGVVIINAVIGFVQESRAQAARDALQELVHTDARVRRRGRELQIPSEEIVPGDIVIIEAGDKVPADLRLLEVTELQPMKPGSLARPGQ